MFNGRSMHMIPSGEHATCSYTTRQEAGCDMGIRMMCLEVGIVEQWDSVVEVTDRL